MSFTPRFCGECGTPLDEEARFCGACGTAITDFQNSTQSKADKKATPAPPPQTEKNSAVPPEKKEKKRVKKQKFWVRRPQFAILSLLLTIGLFTGLYMGAVFLAQEKSPSFVYALAFSPDGKKIASADADELQLWDLRRGTTTARTEITYGVKALAWAQDNTLLALAFYNQIKLYHVADLKPFSTIPIGSDEISALCFAPDGTTLYSMTNRLGLSVWDFYSGKRLGGIPDLPDGLVFDAGFSGDCKRIVALESTTSQSSQPGYIDIHMALSVYQRINMETLMEVQFEGALDKPDFVRLNFNGSRVVGVDSSRLRSWEVNTGKTAEGSLNHPYPTAMALGNINRRIAVGRGKGLIDFYDDTGKYLRSLQHGTSLGLALLPLLE